MALKPLYKSEWLAIYAKADKTVEIDINGVIGGSFFEDGVTAKEFRDELKAINAVEADTVIVNIDSPGGSVSHGLAIHNALVALDAEVEVRIHGMTASAATFVAMAGDTIKMSDTALFLIHNSSGIAFGDKTAIKQAKDTLEKVDNTMAGIYANRTGNTISKVLEWMDAANGIGEWWDVEEALDRGFVDEKFEAMKVAAEYDADILAKAGLKLPKFKNDTTMPKAKDKDTNVTADLSEDSKSWLEGVFAKLGIKAEGEEESEEEEEEEEESEEEEAEEEESEEEESEEEEAEEGSEAEAAAKEIVKRVTAQEKEIKKLKAQLAKKKAKNTKPGKNDDDDEDENSDDAQFNSNMASIKAIVTKRNAR